MTTWQVVLQTDRVTDKGETGPFVPGADLKEPRKAIAISTKGPLNAVPMKVSKPSHLGQVMKVLYQNCQFLTSALQTSTTDCTVKAVLATNIKGRNTEKHCSSSVCYVACSQLAGSCMCMLYASSAIKIG